MQVSSTAGALVQQAALSATKAESRVEGNQPDGDGDKDDASRVAPAQQTANATTASGSIGGNIDVTA